MTAPEDNRADSREDRLADTSGIPLPGVPDRARAVDRAIALSRFVRDRLNARPSWRADLERDLDRPWDAGRMGAALVDPGDPGRALRDLRNRVVVHIATRDLAGLAPLEEVLTTLSTLAEVCIRHAAACVEADLERIYGRPIEASSGRPISLIVVAMGKLGGGELNVSSDIDLVFLYSEDGRTDGTRAIGNHEFFDLYSRRLIALLDERTSDGFVFRVDMRLRPWGDSGPLAMSLIMLEDYLVTQGRPWERYAWIKARVVCGAPDLEIARLVEPFVYRRYLDFSAIASLRELHQQIRAEVARRDRRDDITLGPGGSREIEFITQVFQLIRGGRDRGLRLRGTRAALARLAALRILPDTVVRELLDAYGFLRCVEHRLQYLDDAQTQMLPRSAADWEALADGMGCGDTVALHESLSKHRSQVERHFEAVFASVTTTPSRLSELWWGSASPEDARASLAELGYKEPDEVVRRLQALRAGPRYRGLPDSSRARFDALVPLAIESSARTDQPAKALDRVCDLLQAVASRSSYLALLLEYPRTLDQIGQLAASSRWAAQYLTQHPMLLDEMLDHEVLHGAPDWAALGRQLEATLEQCRGDVEAEMDALRHFKQSLVFRLVVQDLAGLVRLESLSDHLSALADLVLDKVVALAWRDLPRRHRSDEPRFAVIGFGKLGGKELGYGSDLDMIFLYDDEDAAAEVYARLAQRVNQWLNAYTSAGILYETDLRLRPDGASGLLVSSIAAFELYQRDKAWVWEHQALTRARFCAGFQGLQASFDGVRDGILRLPREPATLRAEIVAMRGRMVAEHGGRPGTFDVKQDHGGIIDVEFLVQFVVLAHAASCPELTRNAGNIALLGVAADHGYIPAELARRVADSYRELRKLQHLAWLHEDERARVDPATAAPLIAPVLALWQQLMG